MTPERRSADEQRSHATSPELASGATLRRQVLRCAPKTDDGWTVGGELGKANDEGTARKSGSTLDLAEVGLMNAEKKGELALGLLRAGSGSLEEGREGDLGIGLHILQYADRMHASQHRCEGHMHTRTQRGVDQGKQALKALAARIVTARVEKGLKQEALAEIVGIDQASISRIEKGRAKPSEEVVRELAKALDLDVEELFFLLAPQVVDRVPEEYRRYIRLERNPEHPDTTPTMRSGKREEGRFPIYGLASCGQLATAIKADRLPHGEQRTTDPWMKAKEYFEKAKSKNIFAVEAEGDSMAPAISDGDEVLVDPRAKLTDGCIALVQIGDDATIKRWRVVSGVIILTPDNPDRKKYPERAISTAEFGAEGGTAWRVVMARTTTRFL